MNDELVKCYELLGIAPGTNGPELNEPVKIGDDSRRSQSPDIVASDADRPSLGQIVGIDILEPCSG